LHVVSCCPVANGGEFAGAPYERAIERSVVGAVVVHSVTRRDDIVEAETIGERLH